MIQLINSLICLFLYDQEPSHFFLCQQKEAKSTSWRTDVTEVIAIYRRAESAKAIIQLNATSELTEKQWLWMAESFVRACQN